MNNYGLFFFVTYLLHFGFHAGLFSGLGFASGTAGIMINVVIYVALLAVYIVTSDNWREEARFGLAASAGTIVLYALANYSSASISSEFVRTGVVFFITFIPIWPIMMLLRMSQKHPGGYGEKFLRLYVGALALLGVFLLLLNAPSIEAALPQFTSPDVDVRDDVSGFFANMGERWSSFSGWYAGLLARARDPYSYFRTETNDTVGVVIRDLWPALDVVAKESRIFVTGDVLAISPHRKIDRISIVPSCIMRDSGTAAVVKPSIIDLSIREGGSSGGFICEFPPAGKEGNYKIVGSASFPFLSTASIEYQFADEDTIELFGSNQQGEGTQSQAGIREEDDPEGASWGPVKLDWIKTVQPIEVIDARPWIRPGTLVGFRIMNNWEFGRRSRELEMQVQNKGRVEELHRARLIVPEHFVLSGCSMGPPLSIERVAFPDGISKVYTFLPPVSLGTYASLVCTLELESESATDEVLSQIRSVHRIDGEVEYTYTISAETTVRTQ